MEGDSLRRLQAGNPNRIFRNTPDAASGACPPSMRAQAHHLEIQDVPTHANEEEIKIAPCLSGP